MQNEEHIICINDEIEVDQIMKEMEIQICKVKLIELKKIVMKRSLNTFCNSCKLKEKWHLHNKNSFCWSFIVLMII
jgi:hypothetical protein